MINCDVAEMKPMFWRLFGFECIFNCKNEPIIVIIGGYNDCAKNIHLFNCVPIVEFTLRWALM